MGAIKIGRREKQCCEIRETHHSKSAFIVKSGLPREKEAPLVGDPLKKLLLPSRSKRCNHGLEG